MLSLEPFWGALEYKSLQTSGINLALLPLKIKESPDLSGRSVFSFWVEGEKREKMGGRDDLRLRLMGNWERAEHG
jgi:hypothetical protein